MKRIDRIFEKVKSSGLITAGEIAKQLDLDRANVSADLNQLAASGRIMKDGSSRPVQFCFKKEGKKILHDTELDEYAEANPSMYNAVEQAKAAILYPPWGMNLMLLGETGVGKSMLAGLIHRYMVEIKNKDQNHPFIIFNCADYANNPQLLLAQIFGSRKGAYTGANEDKRGLLEDADNGILFLDEVHRLPPEGQEMLFTFMDRGVFRCLGDNKERYAKVLIIAATTENPNSNLLATFVRRIPMIITIPSLSQRTLEERFCLIEKFFNEEACRLNRPVKVSVNTIKAFLNYSCLGNIGQLKSDIQLACAKAYADFVSHKKEDIEVSSLDLLPYIQNGLYYQTEHRKLWNKLIKVNSRLIVFDPENQKGIIEEDISADNIYEYIDMRTVELKTRGISEGEINQYLEEDLEDYFSKYVNRIAMNNDHVSNLIGEGVMKLSNEIIVYSERRLDRVFSDKVHFAITMHIANLIDRIRTNKKIINRNLNSIMMERPVEFETALDCLKILERVLDMSIPLDEAGFLSLFFFVDEKKSSSKVEFVKIIVIAHGKSTATSMVDTVNTLLGINHAYGLNANLDESPQKVLERLKNKVGEFERVSDILLLVDMGSLTNFAEELEKEFAIRVRMIPLVSTLHVLEATRKAILLRSLDEIYEETLEVNDYTNAVLETIDSEIKNKHISFKRVKIITICSSGEGTAVTLKHVLESKLNFTEDLFEILNMNYIEGVDMFRELKKIEENGKILCIISSFDFQYSLPMFDLESILIGNAISQIQEMINVETTYLKLSTTLSNFVSAIDAGRAVEDIEEFLLELSEVLNIKLSKSSHIGVILHMVCMLDRLTQGTLEVEFEYVDEYMMENKTLYNTVMQKCNTLNEKYKIKIPKDEICFITKFYNK